MKTLSSNLFLTIIIGCIAAFSLFIVSCNNRPLKESDRQEIKSDSISFEGVHFSITGKMNAESETAANSLIEVYSLPDNSRIYELKDSSRFWVELDLNKEYQFNFSKAGFIAKQIAIDTHVPDSVPNEFPPFQIEVQLIKLENKPEEKEPYPVGRIFYNPEIDNFDSEVFIK